MKRAKPSGIISSLYLCLSKYYPFWKVGLNASVFANLSLFAPSRWGAPPWELKPLVVGVSFPYRSCYCWGPLYSLFHCGRLSPQVTTSQAASLLQILVHVTFVCKGDFLNHFSLARSYFFIALIPAWHLIYSPVCCFSSVVRMGNSFAVTLLWRNT